MSILRPKEPVHKGVGAQLLLKKASGGWGEVRNARLPSTQQPLPQDCTHLPAFEGGGHIPCEHQVAPGPRACPGAPAAAPLPPLIALLKPSAEKLEREPAPSGLRDSDPIVVPHRSSSFKSLVLDLANPWEFPILLHATPLCLF